METVRLTLDDIRQMTLQVGEDWAVTQRGKLRIPVVLFNQMEGIQDDHGIDVQHSSQPGLQ